MDEMANDNEMMVQPTAASDNAQYMREALCMVDYNLNPILSLLPHPHVKEREGTA